MTPELATLISTIPQAKTATHRFLRCLGVIQDMIEAGTNIVVRFRDRILQQNAACAPSPQIAADERRFCRVAIATTHAMVLETKLEADPFYRGEPESPPKPQKPALAPVPATPRPSAASRPPRWRGPRSYEQFYAGWNLGDIVESIRRRIGLAGPLGPWFDQLLANHPAVPVPDSTPPITIRPTILHASAPYPPTPSAPPAPSGSTPTRPP